MPKQATTTNKPVPVARQGDHIIVTNPALSFCGREAEIESISSKSPYPFFVRVFPREGVQGLPFCTALTKDEFVLKPAPPEEKQEEDKA